MVTGFVFMMRPVLFFTPKNPKAGSVLNAACLSFSLLHTQHLQLPFGKKPPTPKKEQYLAHITIQKTTNTSYTFQNPKAGSVQNAACLSFSLLHTRHLQPPFGKKPPTPEGEQYLAHITIQKTKNMSYTFQNPKTGSVQNAACLSFSLLHSQHLQPPFGKKPPTPEGKQYLAYATIQKTKNMS